MKKLERQSLRNFKGGLVDPGEGGPACKANTTCGKWVGGAGGHWEAGKCKMGTSVGGLPAICMCDNGGTGCLTV